METNPASAAEALPKSRRSRVTLRLFLQGVGVGICFKVVGDFLGVYDAPGWLKFGLLLLPWLFFAAFSLHMRRVWREDELEKIINRDAFAFAGYGLIFGLILLNQLESAGVVREFKWATGQILLLMVFLMSAGILWSNRRYR
jgi:uncharacterized membrane protein YhdT